MAIAPDRPRAGAVRLEDLPLAAGAVTALGVPGAPIDVTWASAPALPRPLAAAVRSAWAVGIRTAADGLRPAALPTLAAVLAQARGEQVVRALSHRTNLVLPGTRSVVVGDGVLAETLTRMLRRAGARVLRAASAAPARVRAQLDGLELLPDDPSGWPAADTVLATGEGHSALDPSLLAAVVLDASLDGTAVGAYRGTPARPHVTQVGERAWVVAAPPAIADGPHATELDARVADAVVTASLLVALGTGDADARFAELVLA